MHGRSWVVHIPWTPMSTKFKLDKLDNLTPRTIHLLPMGSEHAWEVVGGAHPMDTL